jgi:hypothetical protein
MSDGKRDLLDNIWTDVTITMYYVDRGNVIQRERRVTLEELQEHSDEPLSNQSFQNIVLRAAHAYFQTPVYIGETDETNKARMLSPQAVKEVTITVNNLGTIIKA